MNPVSASAGVPRARAVTDEYVLGYSTFDSFADSFRIGGAVFLATCRPDSSSQPRSTARERLGVRVRQRGVQSGFTTFQRCSPCPLT
jgi:hypothetical protein